MFIYDFLTETRYLPSKLGRIAYFAQKGRIRQKIDLVAMGISMVAMEDVGSSNRSGPKVMTIVSRNTFTELKLVI